MCMIVCMFRAGTQTVATYKGHLGPLGHLYNPSINILSDLQTPLHTGSQAIASLSLNSPRGEYSTAPKALYSTCLG